MSKSFEISRLRRHISSRFGAWMALIGLALVSKLSGAIWLGENYGGGSTRPAIYTDQTFINQIYRLQCRFLNVPGEPGGYLDAVTTNYNSTQRLDRLPPPGLYEVVLFVEYCAFNTYPGSPYYQSAPSQPIQFRVYDGVSLSSYAFLTFQRPTILSQDAMPTLPDGQYKLRAKIMNVPGFPDGFHAATLWNNHGRQLDFLDPNGNDVLPPPGSYPVDLYWLKYNPSGDTITQIGPFNNRSLFLTQSQVVLTTYWFNVASRPAITANQALPDKYKLFAQVIQNQTDFLDTTTQYYNQGKLLDWIPNEPGTYKVRLFWRKYTVEGVEIASGALRDDWITVTNGPLPVLDAAGNIESQEWTDEEGEVHPDTSQDFYDIAVPTAGELRVSGSAGGSLSGMLIAGPPGANLSVVDDAGSATFGFKLQVVAGVYRILVGGEPGSYLLAAKLTPAVSTPAMTSPTVASAALGESFNYALTSSTVATGFQVGGLPPGLSYNPTARTITGMPTQIGKYYVSTFATNASGNGPTTYVEITVAMATPVVTFANRTFVNEPRMHAITGAMLNATVAGLPNLPTPTALPITYRVSQGTNLTPTGSNPLGQYLSPYDQPVVKITATYPGDAIYAETTVEATFRDVIEFTPTPPTEVRAVLRSSGGFGLAWQSAGGVPAGITTDFLYDISVDGGQTVLTTVPYGQLSSVVVGRNAATHYAVSVRARDTFGNQSLWSGPLSVQTLAAGEAPATVPRWLSLSGSGLLDEVIDAGTPAFEHSIIESNPEPVTYSEWVQYWMHIPGYTYTTGSFLDEPNQYRRYYVAPHWDHEWVEETQEITVTMVRPEFRAVPRDDYEYRVGRIFQRPDGTYGLNEIYTVNPDDTISGINRWLPPGPWSEPVYYTIPFVLVRKSLAPSGCILNLPGMGTTATANAAKGTITLGNGTKITAGPTGATVAIPGLGTVMIGTDGSISVAGGGPLPTGVTHTPGVPSLGLPGGITVNPGTGEVTIAGLAGSSVTVGGPGGLRVALPPGLASIAGVVGKAVDILGTIFGGGTDPTKTKVENGDGTWRDVDDPLLGEITGNQTVRVGATTADRPTPLPTNIFTISFTATPATAKIVPDAGAVGVIGDRVPSFRQNGMDHFVTPKASPDIPAEHAVFAVTNISAADIGEGKTYRWSGGAPHGTDPTKRLVSRGTPDMIELRMVRHADNLVVARMRVWVVWATTVAGDIVSAHLRGTHVGTLHIDPNHAAGAIFRCASGSTDIPNSRIGWAFRFRIAPERIFDSTDDVPALGGPNRTNPPGWLTTFPTEPLRGSADTATTKWDVARQKSVSVRNTAGATADSLISPEIWWIGQPVAGVKVAVPFPLDVAAGNDNPVANFEEPVRDGNPYQARGVADSSGLGHEVAEVSSVDTPRIDLRHSAAANSANGGQFIVTLNFREFVRLEISDGARNQGRTWFKISDYSLWHFRMSCLVQAGRWIDNQSSSETGSKEP